MKDKKVTYHFVSQSHWDREWVLSFEEYRVLLVDMWDALFELLESNSGFKHFMTDGQMQMIIDYLEIKPQNFNRIKKLVEDKKLSIGPWYIQIDQFLPSGESHIRNLLLGFEMARRFGEPMKVGYIPDQFGHIAQMPQILNGFDIDTAVIYRGFGGEPGQESSEYIWKSPDESKVLMFHLPKDGYSFGYFAMDDDEMIVQRFERLRKEIDTRAQTSHRLILNGGDHHWPDFKLPYAIKILEEKYPEFDFIHSTLEDYADKVKSEVKLEKLPELLGETRFGLKHAFAVIGGTASSRIYVKQKNYSAQIKLEKILEPLNAFAFVFGCKDRSEIIKQAWLYCLQNQDHDTINGTCVDRVYHEAMTRYLKIEEIFNALTFQIANDLMPYDSKFYKDDVNLFIFNFLPFALDKVIECEVEFHLQDIIVGLNPDVKSPEKGTLVSGFKIFDQDGNEIKYQILDRSERYSLVWGYYEYPHQTLVESFKILLDVKNFPSFGFKKFNIVRVDEFPEYGSGISYGESGDGEFFMENKFLRVEASKDGSLRVFDKEKKIEFDKLNIFEESGDAGDEYNYCFPEKDEIYYSTDIKPEKIEFVETGPLRFALQIKYKMLVPQSTDIHKRSDEKVEMEIVSTVYLEENSKRVDFKTKVNNTARDHRLRVIFDTGIDTNISYADSQFCVVKRTHRKYNWDEYPYEKPLNLEVFQRFVCLQDKSRGFAVFAKGLPEYELSLDKPGRIAITLLRGVGQLSKSNLKTRPGGDAGWKNETPDAQCLGLHEFDYSIYLFKPGDLKDVNFQAELYHNPTFYFKRKQDVESLKLASLFEIESDVAVLSAFKVSEDKKAVILRFYNPLEKFAEARVKLNFKFKEVALAKLNESKISTLTPDVNGTFTVNLSPFKILTLRIEI